MPNTVEQTRDKLGMLGAAIDCPHEITTDRIILKRSPSQGDGNACSQLGDRLDKALQRLTGAKHLLAQNKVVVNAKALRELLAALNGPGYLIREIQATRGLRGLDNPIETLLFEFNEAAVLAHQD